MVSVDSVPERAGTKATDVILYFLRASDCAVGMYEFDHAMRFLLDALSIPLSGGAMDEVSASSIDESYSGGEYFSPGVFQEFSSRSGGEKKHDIIFEAYNRARIVSLLSSDGVVLKLPRLVIHHLFHNSLYFACLFRLIIYLCNMYMYIWVYVYIFQFC